MMDYNLMEERLRDDYREVFEKAELYGVIKNIDTDVMDDKLMNLFDLLLTAQTNEKPVKNVIGSDVETFCEGYFQDYNMKERIRRFPKLLYRMMKFIFIFEVIDFLWLQDNDVSIFHASSNALPFMTGILVGIIGTFLVDIILRPLMFRTKKVKVICYYIGILLLQGALIFIGVAFTVHYEISILMFPAMVASFGYIVIYLAIRSVRRYKQYGTIRKPKLVESDYDKVSLKQSIESSLPNELVKKYEKKNKRLARRGEPGITPEQFMNDIRKEDSKTVKMWKIMRYIYAMFVIIPTVMDYFISEDGIIESLIYMCILAVIEFFIYRELKKVSDAEIDAREKLMDECESLGVNIIEYVKMNKDLK